MSNAKLTLQEIWRLGCAGESLASAEQKHFVDLAASRFHTFVLSADSAYQSKAALEAKEWVDLLVKGLVTELVTNPGLRVEWEASPYKDHVYGILVSASLLKTQIH